MKLTDLHSDNIGVDNDDRVLLHGRPRHEQELSEDVHILMRCLHPRLPLHLITKETNTSKSVDRFVQQYGARFGDFAEKQGAVHMIQGVRRLRYDMILQVLNRWLSARVNTCNNTFQWEGLTMTSADISRTTEKACCDWFQCYVWGQHFLNHCLTVWLSNGLSSGCKLRV